MKKNISAVLFVCGLVPSALFAAEKDPNSYADKFPTIPQNARVVLLPMAYDFSAAAQETPIVQAAIVDQLKTLGFRPVKIKLEPSSMPPGIDRVYLTPNLANKNVRPSKQVYLHDVSSQVPFDIALIPAVLSRTAKLSGQTARWDNVKVHLNVKGYGSGMSTEWRGTSLGLSLELDAYDSKGQWLFTSYGGISLPYVINTKEAMNILKPRLFESEKDQESLRQGVEAALEPLTEKIKISKN